MSQSQNLDPYWDEMPNRALAGTIPVDREAEEKEDEEGKLTLAYNVGKTTRGVTFKIRGFERKIKNYRREINKAAILAKR